MTGASDASPPPPPPGPFLGREAALAAVRDALRRSGWVTVVGPIGVGKTRLALELSAGVGVPARCRFHAMEAGQAIPWPAPAATDGWLVLDAGDAEPPPDLPGEARARLAADPALRVIATARAPLGLEGEAVVRLGPLPRAAARAVLRGRIEDDAGEVGAAPPIEGDDRALDRIVDAVDGLPLLLGWIAPLVARVGVERAGRWLDVDPLLAVAEGTADGPARHRRLEAAVAGPVTALPATLRQTLVDACVFHGRFGADDARAVLAGAEPLEAALAALAARGLLRSGRRPDGVPWLAPWALIRAHLRRSARRSPGVDERHTAHVLAAARDAGREGPLDVARELDAVAHGIDDDVPPGAPGPSLRAAIALAEAVTDRRAPERALALLDRRLPGIPSAGFAPPDVGGGDTGAGSDGFDRDGARWLARGHLARGRLGHRLGRDPRAVRADLARAVRGGAACGDGALEGEALIDLARHEADRGERDAARAHYVDALRRLRAAGDGPGEARARSHLAAADQEAGALDAAERGYRRALEAARRAGDRRTEGVVLQNLSLVALERGALDDARRFIDEAWAVHRELGHRRFEGVSAFDVATLQLFEGRPGAARRAVEEAVAVFDEIGDVAARLLATARLGGALAELGDAPRAGRRLAEARDGAARLGLDAVARVAALESGSLDLARARADWAHGDDGAARAGRERASALTRRDGARDEQVRLSLARLEAALAVDADPGRTLVVDAEARWLRAPAAPLADLGRSPVLRAVLQALVTARLDAGPGVAIPRDALRDAAWPGERMRDASARNRLDVALSKLRRLGLDAPLVRRDDGWTLCPDTPVRIATAPRRRAGAARSARRGGR